MHACQDERWVRRHKAAFAWCGADGSLLKPISLATSESMPEIERDFTPWVRRMQQVRQEHGLSAAETVPVFHSTDSYGKHRKKLTSLYVRLFKALRVTSAHTTPKASASGTRLLGDFQSPVAAMVTVTADPQHDLFALRKLVRTGAHTCLRSGVFPKKASGPGLATDTYPLTPRPN